MSPTLAKRQPCGCVVCTCDDAVRCHGCGAMHCGTHPVGQFAAPQYKENPACQAAMELVARAYIQRLPFVGTLGEHDNAVRKLVTLLAAQRAAVLEDVRVAYLRWLGTRIPQAGHDQPRIRFEDWLQDNIREQQP